MLTVFTMASATLICNRRHVKGILCTAKLGPERLVASAAFGTLDRRVTCYAHLANASGMMVANTEAVLHLAGRTSH